jgi:flagellin
MKIQTNTAANTALRFASANAQATERSIQRLSSGFRINRAGDDAAGLAIANGMRADVRGLQQAQRNTSQAMSMLQTMDGGAQTISTILDRMKELATQANSSNAGGDAKANLDAEFQALVSEIDRIVGSTTYQGQKLLDGSTTFNFQVSASESGAGDDMIEIDTTANVVLGSTDLAVDGQDLTTAAGAATALAAVDAAVKLVGTALGDIGAAQSRMDFAATNVATMLENTQAAESTVRDANMAEEMTRFTKNNILQQAAQSMLAQANQGQQGILQLLRG